MNPAKTDVASSLNIVICLGKVRQMLLIRQSLENLVENMSDGEIVWSVKYLQLLKLLSPNASSTKRNHTLRLVQFQQVDLT